MTTFTVSVMNHLNKPCTYPHQLTTTLQSLEDDSVVETTQTSKREAKYEVQYTATQSSRHQLHVNVNGVEIQGSPFEVSINPGGETLKGMKFVCVLFFLMFSHSTASNI